MQNKHGKQSAIPTHWTKVSAALAMVLKVNTFGDIGLLGDSDEKGFSARETLRELTYFTSSQQFSDDKSWKEDGSKEQLPAWLCPIMMQRKHCKFGAIAPAKAVEMIHISDMRNPVPSIQLLLWFDVDRFGNIISLSYSRPTTATSGFVTSRQDLAYAPC
jgi:hypothetical protein